MEVWRKNSWVSFTILQKKTISFYLIWTYLNFDHDSLHNHGRALKNNRSFISVHHIVPAKIHYLGCYLTAASLTLPWLIPWCLAWYLATVIPLVFSYRFFIGKKVNILTKLYCHAQKDAFRLCAKNKIMFQVSSKSD